MNATLPRAHARRCSTCGIHDAKGKYQRQVPSVPVQGVVAVSTTHRRRTACPAGVGWCCCMGARPLRRMHRHVPQGKCRKQHAATSNGLSCRRRCCCMGRPTLLARPDLPLLHGCPPSALNAPARATRQVPQSARSDVERLVLPTSVLLHGAPDTSGPARLALNLRSPRHSRRSQACRS